MRRFALTFAAAAVLAPLAVGSSAERPSVVAVRVWSAAGEVQHATGTIVAPGRVLTVDHVLGAGDRIEVLTAGGVRRRATVARRRADLDLAVLRVPGATGPPVRVSGGATRLRVLVERDGAVEIRPAMLRRRILARLLDQPGRPRRPSLELAATVSAGDSGAPVLNHNGALVGIVYARSTRREGTAYAVRVNGGDLVHRVTGPGPQGRKR
jgi:S1-C subfamily serine protease